jgi:hypothetical protein
LNHWQRESGDFVSRVEAVACEDASLNYRHRDDCGQCYVAAIDYGERKDRSVATLLHREGDLLIVDRMEVWQGSPADPVPLAAVEQWIADAADRFHRPLFMINPFQMLSTIQKFEPQFAVERGEARNGRGNYQLALNLRSLIVGRRIKWYPDCGRIMDCKGKVSTLTDELCSVICSETSYGWKSTIIHPSMTTAL